MASGAATHTRVGCELRPGGVQVVGARWSSISSPSGAGRARPWRPRWKRGRRHEGKVKIAKLDVDQNPAVTQEYKIQAMPR